MSKYKVIKIINCLCMLKRLFSDWPHRPCLIWPWPDPPWHGLAWQDGEAVSITHVGIFVFNYANVYSRFDIKKILWYITLYLDTFEIKNLYEQIRQDFIQCIAKPFFSSKFDLEFKLSFNKSTMTKWAKYYRMVRPVVRMLRPFVLLSLCLYSFSRKNWYVLYLSTI